MNVDRDARQKNFKNDTMEICEKLHCQNSGLADQIRQQRQGVSALAESDSTKVLSGERQFASVIREDRKNMANFRERSKQIGATTVQNDGGRTGSNELLRQRDAAVNLLMRGQSKNKSILEGGGCDELR